MGRATFLTSTMNNAQYYIIKLMRQKYIFGTKKRGKNKK